MTPEHYPDTEPAIIWTPAELEHPSEDCTVVAYGFLKSSGRRHPKARAFFATYRAKRDEFLPFHPWNEGIEIAEITHWAVFDDPTTDTADAAA